MPLWGVVWLLCSSRATILRNALSSYLFATLTRRIICTFALHLIAKSTSDFLTGQSRSREEALEIPVQISCSPAFGPGAHLHLSTSNTSPYCNLSRHLRWSRRCIFGQCRMSCSSWRWTAGVDRSIHGRRPAGFGRLYRHDSEI